MDMSFETKLWSRISFKSKNNGGKEPNPLTILDSKLDQI